MQPSWTSFFPTMALTSAAVRRVQTCTFGGAGAAGAEAGDAGEAGDGAAPPSGAGAGAEACSVF